MPYTLLATACPPPMVPSVLRLVSAAVLSANGTAPASANFSVGMSSLLASALNGNALRSDLVSLYGGGLIRAVGMGLTLTAGTGAAVNIAPGHAVGDGIIELPITLTNVALSDGLNYVYIDQTSPVTVSVVSASLAPPGGTCVYLGRVTVASGAVSLIESSGVFYAGSGLRYRMTGDTSAPTDTAPAGCPPFLTLTASGATYLYNPASGTHVAI